MKNKLFFGFGILMLGIASCTSDKGEAPKPIVALTPCELVSYNTDISPIMATNCIGCHSSSFTGYDLTNYTGVKQKVDNGSLRLRVLETRDMPGYCVLPADDLQKIECWINNGAPNN